MAVLRLIVHVNNPKERDRFCGPCTSHVLRTGGSGVLLRLVRIGESVSYVVSIPDQSSSPAFGMI